MTNAALVLRAFKVPLKDDYKDAYDCLERVRKSMRLESARGLPLPLFIELPRGVCSRKPAKYGGKRGLGVLHPGPPRFLGGSTPRGGYPRP